MFAKLKKSSFFKSLLEHLCSIEIVETKNKIPASSHYSRVPPTPSVCHQFEGSVVEPFAMHLQESNSGYQSAISDIHMQQLLNPTLNTDGAKVRGRLASYMDNGK